jgi:hypothetical protein
VPPILTKIFLHAEASVAQGPEKLAAFAVGLKSNQPTKTVNIAVERRRITMCHLLTSRYRQA